MKAIKRRGLRKDLIQNCKDGKVEVSMSLKGKDAEERGIMLEQLVKNAQQDYDPLTNPTVHLSRQGAPVNLAPFGRWTWR